MKYVFYSRVPFMRYATTDGTIYHFNGGRCFVDEGDDNVAELSAAAARQGCPIYVKEGEEKVNPEDLDPLAIIKKKAVEEYLATQAAAHNKEFGDSAPASTAPLSTADIASVDSGKEAVAVPKSLEQLKSRGK